MSLIIKIKVPKGEAEIKIPEKSVNKENLSAVEKLASRFAQDLSGADSTALLTPATSATTSVAGVNETTGEVAHNGHCMTQAQFDNTITPIPTSHFVLNILVANNDEPRDCFRLVLHPHTKLSTVVEHVRISRLMRFGLMKVTHRGKRLSVFDTKSLDDDTRNKHDTEKGPYKGPNKLEDAAHNDAVFAVVSKDSMPAQEDAILGGATAIAPLDIDSSALNTVGLNENMRFISALQGPGFCPDRIMHALVWLSD